MKRIKSVSIPVGVLLISSFYFVGAVVLLVFFFVNPGPAAASIALRHGLPASSGSWILPVMAGVGLLIGFGLLSLSKAGFFLTIAYLLYFGIVNLYMSDGAWISVYGGDVIWSVMVIVYLILARSHFFKAGREKAIQIQE